MFDLTGKTALITGATGSIGNSIAKTLHKAGAHVIISGTRENILNSLKDELKERCTVITANLSDRESVVELAKKSEEVLNGVDILVNNAGITRDGLGVRMKDEDWDTVLSVNLSAIFILTREIVKKMMRRKNGRVINISSVVGISGNPGQMNYCASKAGIIGMSKSLAQEVASRGITVNNVAPGFISSDMTENLSEKQKEAILSKIPSSRMGDSSEIASGVLYLASDESSYITGQTLNINGGMLMV